MESSVETVTTDTLGRRTGPRRLRTNEEKRRIVEETLKPGASVAIVAREPGVNAAIPKPIVRSGTAMPRE